jgi:hypothetical protein
MQSNLEWSFAYVIDVNDVFLCKSSDNAFKWYYLSEHVKSGVLPPKPNLFTFCEWDPTA